MIFRITWKVPLPRASGRRSTVVLVGVADSVSWPSRRAEADEEPLSRTASESERGVTVSGVLTALRSVSVAGADADVLPAASAAVTTTRPLGTVKPDPAATATGAPPSTEYARAARPEPVSEPVGMQ